MYLSGELGASIEQEKPRSGEIQRGSPATQETVTTRQVVQKAELTRQ